VPILSFARATRRAIEIADAAMLRLANSESASKLLTCTPSDNADDDLMALRLFLAPAACRLESVLRLRAKALCSFISFDASSNSKSCCLYLFVATIRPSAFGSKFELAEAIFWPMTKVLSFILSMSCTSTCICFAAFDNWTCGTEIDRPASLL